MNAKQWYQRRDKEKTFHPTPFVCSEMDSSFPKPLTNSSISPILIRPPRHFSAIPGHYQILSCAGDDSNSKRRFHGPNSFGSLPLKHLTTLCAVGPPFRSRLHCVSSSAASFASGGGGGGFGGEGGGDGNGDGGSGGRDSQAEDAAAGDMATDVIILDVGGMSCGGCASSVKRILESQPQVSSATVNLETETAIVWPASDAKAIPNWQTQLGEALANHLTSCGFKSNLRGQSAIEGDVMQ